ncbi:uncharacterized protein LOC133645778 [Entelurus aequoreus]|uniref:uncharacterized protein LOC133645778 n=1 Tax=Entelurus aequoreus TaxID=161455 RepID=UPI002B1D1CE5|nr:uncharacterized protein LOC133645778 [Entelurus aequoreus]
MAFTYRMTDGDIRQLIHLRATNNAIFTGQKNSAMQGWRAIRREMGLQAMLSASQLKKKWGNMKEKYRAIKNSPGGLQNRTKSWRWFHLMDEALSGRLAGSAKVVEPSVLDDDEDAVPHFSFASMLARTPELNVTETGRVEGVPVPRDVFSLGTEVCGDNIFSKTESHEDAGPDLHSRNGVLYPSLLSKGIVAQSDNMAAMSAHSCPNDEERRALERRSKDIERDRANVERDRANVERERLALERDRAQLERDRISIQRDRAAIERDKVCLDRDRAFLDRDAAFLERDRALLERAKALLRCGGEPELVQTRLYQNLLAKDVDPLQLESTQRLVSLFQKLVEKF